ncbi:type II toxin-antitoxin system PemK/MazF family toxin [Nocardioides marmoriginsengisoli]|uniref:type II toxin-antitoxin system PemK/MazF family toxin n=1 Tax=Nocardioides marmoriginsengisoli TaxID=661483 RepID=UPI001FE550AC|nr:type II toxin-antitoxin system PemK/MazF family toxin [Nocardioides marmoriginsengisoli]
MVWTWVAFEEGSRAGKDRPVLVLAVDGARITALPLRTRTDQQRRKQVWMDLGSGDWDRSGRSSEVQLNRVLTVSVYDVRRQGAELDEDLFAEVVRASRRYR